MKIKTNVRPHASAMILTLLTATIIGIALASYFSFVSQQNLSVARSLAWNGTVPVMEAGVEEALTQIYYNGFTNLSANSWTLAGDGLYHKTRSIADGTYCEIAIQPVNPPVIYSTGYTPAPLTPSTQLGMVLGAITAPRSDPYVKRRVRVTTVGTSSLGAAVISKGPIYLSGNNVSIDSFDSSDPLYNTLGKYDSAKSKDNGNIVTDASDGLTSNGKPLYALEVGDADIKGHVTTGPTGTVDVTSGGTVGDSAWVTAATPGVKPGWQSNDANLDIPDVQLPDFSGGYSTPGAVTIGKVKYTYYLPIDGNYKLDTTLGGKVLVTGNATLWVTGDVNIGTGDYIQIAPGASLKLYVSGASAVIGGQGIVNSDGYARGFQYYGLPTNTSIDYKGNSSFTGTINAPEADLKLGGGGTTDYDFVGSAVVKTFTMNGHFHIHYDEALRAAANGFVVSSWNEVDPNAPLK